MAMVSEMPVATLAGLVASRTCGSGGWCITTSIWRSRRRISREWSGSGSMRARSRRRGGVLRQGARAGWHARGRAAAPVPGDNRRVRARADPRAHPPRQAAPGADGPPGGHVVRALRLPVGEEDRAQRGFLEIDAIQAEVVREVRALHQRRCVDRRDRPLADRARRADPDRQGGVGPLERVGDAAQPRLPRRGGVRQDQDARAPASRHAAPALAASATAVGRHEQTNPRRSGR